MSNTANNPAEEIKLADPSDEIVADIKTLAALREKYLAIKKPHGFTAAGALHTTLSTLSHLIVALEAKPTAAKPEPKLVVLDANAEAEAAKEVLAEILKPEPTEPVATAEPAAPVEQAEEQTAEGSDKTE